MKNILKTIAILAVSALVFTSCGKKGDDPTPAPVTPNKTSQNIAFGTIPSKSVGDANFTLSALASSGLSVTFTSSNPAVATVTSDGTVTIVGAGTTTITATQAGDATYSSASATQPLTVTAPHVYKSGASDYIYVFSNGTAFKDINKTIPAGQLYTYHSGYVATSTTDVYNNSSDPIAISDGSTGYVSYYKQ